jgi:hypothetical protein
MREWPSIVPGTPEDYYIVVITTAGSVLRSPRPTSNRL